MLSSNLEKLYKSFDEILNVDTENNIEFWYARDLQECLGYARWENCHRRTIIDPNRRKEIDPPRPYSYHWDCEDHQGGSENDKEWANTDDKTGSTIWSNSVRNREEIGHIQEHCEEIYQRCT